ncbi:MAG TPA: right-handed parallel beta-helix repeat-containing protein [Chloroflexota bacterium]|nr:right-handed parallel beta-helix repeat-containing protein [Chloroflexota bacterium]
MNVRILAVPAVLLLALASLIPSPGSARAAAGPDFYVAPASAGGSDSNDCSQAAQGGSGIGPCASLYKATSAASAWFVANGSNQAVSVYMEPGTYNTSPGFNCSSSAPTVCTSGSGSSCNLSSAACLAYQVIYANGSASYPITVSGDPNNQGDVVFERPASAGTYAQETPILSIYDSTNVDVSGLQVEGVIASGSPACLSGACVGTGCASTCVTPSNSTGEIDINYPSYDAPTPGAESGISLDNVTASDSNFTCLFVSEAEYVNISNSSFTNCGLPGGSSAVFLGAGNETFSLDTVEYSTGNGIYISTSNSSYPAYPVTISGSNLDNNAKYGTNTGIGEGSSPSTIQGNSVYNNGSAGIQANWGAYIEDNAIYSNSGPGLELNWFTSYGCTCSNLIENNSFYQNSTSNTGSGTDSNGDPAAEIVATSNTNPIVTLEYNTFYMNPNTTTGDHLWLGTPVNPFCDNNGIGVSAVGFNDYYDESSQSPNFPYDVGMTSLSVDPQYLSTSPGAENLDPQNAAVTTNQSPAWGDPNPVDADSNSGIVSEPAPDPTDAQNITNAINVEQTLVDLNPAADGSQDLPATYPQLTAAQIAACDPTCWHDYQAQYPPSSADDVTPDANGVYWAPNHGPWDGTQTSKGWGCPEPNANDNYGQNWCPGYTSPVTWPQTNAGNPVRDKRAKSPLPTTKGDFYADLCGPGSAAYIMMTWDKDLVYDWNLGLSGKGVHWDETHLNIKASTEPATGYYQFLYHAAYLLMYYAPPYAWEHSWNSYFTDERDFFNKLIPKSWGIRFVAEKHYRPEEGYHAGVKELGTSVTAESHLNVAIQEDIVKGDRGTANHKGLRGAIMVGVDAHNLADGSGGNYTNHYMSIDGWVRNYTNSGKPAVIFMDTAYNGCRQGTCTTSTGEPSGYGDNPSNGYAAKTTDFVPKILENCGPWTAQDTTNCKYNGNPANGAVTDAAVIYAPTV